MEAPRILLEGAQEKPLFFSGEADVAVEALGGEPLLAISPLALEGEISFVDGEYFLDSVLSFEGSLECSRCLEPYEFREKGPVRLRLHPRPGAAGEEAGARRRESAAGPEAEGEPLDEADLDVVFYDEPVLPLEEIAREQALISLPMKPLCSEDCRGLCPECGKNLNAGDCACAKERVDPRLEVLKKFK